MAGRTFWRFGCSPCWKNGDQKNCASATGAQPTAEQGWAAAQLALAELRRQVDADAVALLASDDLAHHQRLITVMLVVAAAASLGIWLGERAAALVDRPIRLLGSHLARVSRGDFGQRVPEAGPIELSRLASAVNRMTEDLDRLYASERAGPARGSVQGGHGGPLRAWLRNTTVFGGSRLCQ